MERRNETEVEKWLKKRGKTTDQKIEEWLEKLDNNKEKVIKTFAIYFGVIGVLIAILFPPCRLLGFRRWQFVFGDAGFGVKNYQLIDPHPFFLNLY